MSQASPVPLVIFYLYRRNDLEIGYGYLNRGPDGVLWLFPDAQTFDQNPALAGAIRLDPQHLREVINNRSSRQLFVYQQVVNSPQEDNQGPPSVSGHFQAMQIRT